MPSKRMLAAFDRVIQHDGDVGDAIDTAIRAQADGDDPLPREHVEIGRVSVEKSDLLRFFEVAPG